MNKNERKLLELVIKYYTKTGQPVGSKFLDGVGGIKMAPSTIRKYLNLLEKKGLVYQPYNSAGRVPTVEGVEKYLSSILLVEKKDFLPLTIKKRFSLREFVEKLGDKIDGVAFGFYEDEKDIHYLGVSKILKKVNNNIEKIIPLMEFIEKKQIITYLNKKNIEKNKINYNFVNYQGINIVLMYINVSFSNSSAILGSVSSLRVNYKNNISILENILNKGTI